jgi:hypothetical protein
MMSKAVATAIVPSPARKPLKRIILISRSGRIFMQRNAFTFSLYLSARLLTLYRVHLSQNSALFHAAVLQAKTFQSRRARV